MIFILQRDMKVIVPPQPLRGFGLCRDGVEKRCRDYHIDAGLRALAHMPLQKASHLLSL